MIQRISGGNKPIKSAYDEGYFYNKESIINFVIKSDKFYIKYVLALLNSNLINWYYSKEFSNESKLTVNLSKEYLSDIPIKNISLDEQIMFVELVDKIIDIKNRIKSCKTPQEDKLLNVQLTKIDEQINIKIYELYDLNNEEINIIENSFTK